MLPFPACVCVHARVCIHFSYIINVINKDYSIDKMYYSLCCDTDVGEKVLGGGKGKK